MEWQKIGEHTPIVDGTMYLVKTNGGEWRDGDLFILPGFAVKKKLEPQIVRGRATHIAVITEPEAGVSQSA